MTRSPCQVLGAQICNSSYCTVSHERIGLCVALCIHWQWEEKQNQDRAVTRINSWTEKELGNLIVVQEWGVEALPRRWLSSRTSLTARRLLCWLATWVLPCSNWLVSPGQQYYPILHNSVAILTWGWCTDTQLSVAGSSKQHPCQLQPSCLTHQTCAHWKGWWNLAERWLRKQPKLAKRGVLVAGVGNEVRWQLQLLRLHNRFDMGSREGIQQNTVA